MPPAGHTPQESGWDQTDVTPPNHCNVQSDTHTSLEDDSAHPDSAPMPATANTPASPCPSDAHTTNEHEADLCPSEGVTDML